VDPSKIPVGAVNNDWTEKVQVDLSLVAQNVAHLNIYDAAKKGFMTPETVLPRAPEDFQANVDQTFTVSLDPFSFELKDRSNGNVVLQTNNRKLVFQDKFMEMGFEVKSQDVYGLGLSNRQFTLETGAYTMYSKSRAHGSVTDKSLGGQQGPAVHPFVMFKTDDNQFAAIYFPNSSPAQFEVIRYEGYDWTILNYIAVSGTVEAYFILPDSAENVIAQYQKMIGLPAFPPIHALGFYQGSDSYKQLSDLQDADKSYQDMHFIVEGYNLDNYNELGHQVLTVDKTKFAGIEKWVSALNAEGRSLILGVMDGASSDSAAFTKLQSDSSLLLMDSATVIMNQLKDTYVAYPDWFSDKTAAYYATGLKDVQTFISAFQGINLADNTNFGYCDSSCKPKTEAESAVLDIFMTLAEKKRFL